MDRGDPGGIDPDEGDVMQVTTAARQEENGLPDSIQKIGVRSVMDNVVVGQQLDGQRLARLFGHLFGNELAVAIRERTEQQG